MSPSVCFSGSVSEMWKTPNKDFTLLIRHEVFYKKFYPIGVAVQYGIEWFQLAVRQSAVPLSGLSNTSPLTAPLQLLLLSALKDWMPTPLGEKSRLLSINASLSSTLPNLCISFSSRTNYLSSGLFLNFYASNLSSSIRAGRSIRNHLV